MTTSKSTSTKSSKNSTSNIFSNKGKGRVGEKGPLSRGAKEKGGKKLGASLLQKKEVAKTSNAEKEFKSEQVKVLPTLSLIEEKKPSSPRTAPLRKILPRIGATKEVEPEVEVSIEEVEENLVPSNEDVTDRKVIHIKPPIMIKELAAQMEVKSFKVIHDLMEMNIFANINQSVEPEVAAKLCERYGFIFEREKRVAGAGLHKTEAVIVEPPLPSAVATTDNELSSRAPMRARGANLTDLVVLVVAADDGLMPQTLEALSHARAANVTIMVAINKVDLPAANVDRVKAQLQEQGLIPEDWGGETVCCEVSAMTGKGIDHLLEMMLLHAEMLELKADPAQSARASVIEAQVEAGRGPTATVIITNGTLKLGDAFICGNYWGKLKQIINDVGQPIKEAPPAMPVKVLGLSGLPNAGDELIVMDSERAARQLSEERLEDLRSTKLAAPQRATLENLFKNLEAEQKKVLNIILKSDMQGSLEAIIGALGEIPKDKVDLKIVHSGVGPVSESDVLLATTSDAVIIGFSVKLENTAATIARREGIQIKLYSIIYELIDQLREAMAGLLDPELRESVIGHATVKQVFELTRGIVAGCQVSDGRIARTARARVLRRRQAVYDGGIGTLRRFTEDVKEVRAGLECGIRLGDFNDYEEGDIIECYTLEKIAQTL